MRTHEFTIIASDLDHRAEDFENRLFEAGCGDATIAFVKGAIRLDFEREATTFAKALLTAIQDVRRAGAKIERIEPDYLVNTTDIAKRSGLSKAAISLFTSGQRAKEQEFPKPVARVTSDSPLWDWFYVARWMFQRHEIDLESVVQAKLLREANRAVTADKFEHSSFFRRAVNA
jgi:hypothetical protein